MNTKQLEQLCTEVLNDYPDKVKYYKLGKKNLIGLFAGEVMKRSKSEADPKTTVDILMKMLS